ncbi:MAG: ribosomal subunit interface protein [Deltaproteobacteria bacterium CG2_30_63_29]|nr:MAG: ribosomal subunit interface protein [Deltaproteobacteria bacterium CG2_30_63_29]PIW00302.1 MAG: ribosomal subunit interface protein [Deltaproteobacteria bacterium CG17_big_fil_post_rev_8_21_14_2_50_63_7]PJB35293.1 MAG: ribosomal subunit interface protein [Deltaproteobacteria bacterium CG_4_9_14_3_um_filter_63_12]
MQVYVSFRHMEPSEPLKEYAEEKIKRVIRKYIRGNFDAQVTLAVEKFRHIANFLVSYKGLSIKCEESSDDMYSSIDLALDKLERQVRRYKDKLRSHQPSEGRDRLFELSVIAAPAEGVTDEFEVEENFEDDDEDAAAEETSSPTEETKPDLHVLQREVMTAFPMSVEDAMMQLDLEQKAFLVFTSTETNSLSVLYRLADGNFGLIEPRT